MFAPAGTPARTIDRLNSELARILHRPEIVERFRDGGSDVTTATPRAFAELVRKDYQRWGEVVRRLGITAK
jgi:tripartite-type tricarboxylate transporter receptor subunit TctC